MGRGRGVSLPESQVQRGPSESDRPGAVQRQTAPPAGDPEEGPQSAERTCGTGEPSQAAEVQRGGRGGQKLQRLRGDDVRREHLPGAQRLLRGISPRGLSGVLQKTEVERLLSMSAVELLTSCSRGFCKG